MGRFDAELFEQLGQLLLDVRINRREVKTDKKELLPRLTM